MKVQLASGKEQAPIQALCLLSTTLATVIYPLLWELLNNRGATLALGLKEFLMKTVVDQFQIV